MITSNAVKNFVYFFFNENPTRSKESIGGIVSRGKSSTEHCSEHTQCIQEPHRTNLNNAAMHPTNNESRNCIVPNK